MKTSQDRGSLLGRPQQQHQQQHLEPQPQQHLDGRGTVFPERRPIDSNEAPTIQEQHAFLDAAKYANFALVRTLVLAKPSLINCQPAGRWSALHQAAMRGNSDTVRFLLDRGASTTAQTSDGRTPLDVADASVFDLLFTAMSISTNEDDTVPQVTSDEALESLGIRHFLPLSAVEECQCHICLQDFADGDKLRTLPCKHSFHVECVDTWLKLKMNCPTCRAEFPKS